MTLSERREARLHALTVHHDTIQNKFHVYDLAMGAYWSCPYDTREEAEQAIAAWPALVALTPRADDVEYQIEDGIPQIAVAV